MSRYIIRRLIQAIPTLIGISFLTFLLISLVPGGPAAAFTANNPHARSSDAKAAVIHNLGLDQPWPVQYLSWVDRLLHGDFGRSFFNDRPVLDLVKERIPATLELGVTSLILGLLIGVPIGVWSAVRQGSWFDNVSRILAVIASSIPAFWLGLMLILLFGKDLGWLPMGGRSSDQLVSLTGIPALIDRIQHMILPVTVLTLFQVAGYSRYMRAATLEVSRQDYIRTAQSKGLTSPTVWLMHAARNALIPLCTFLGPAITGVLGGAVITETVFSWPGLGYMIFDAVQHLDIPVVMIAVLIGGIGTILGYLLSDILYAVVDPRIRY